MQQLAKAIVLVIASVFLVLVFISASHGQSLTLEQIYSEMVAPEVQSLAHENFVLRAQVHALQEQIQELQKQVVALTPKTAPEPATP